MGGYAYVNFFLLRVWVYQREIPSLEVSGSLPRLISTPGQRLGRTVRLVMGWLYCVPANSWAEVLIPGTSDRTLFGNRIVVEVIG